MHPAILVALAITILLCGPICGGIRWHVWNREHGRNPFVYRHAEDEPRDLEDEEERLTA